MIKHIVSSSDLSKEEYLYIIKNAEKFRNDGVPPELLKNKIVATLFFQPSTRTMTAFQSGIIRGGGGWIGVTGQEALSMEKGEDLHDTIGAFSGVCDAIAIRHPDDNSSEVAAKAATVPVLNCGAGSREHATGTAFMLSHMYFYLKRLDNLKIGIYGTPQINRATKAMVPIFGYFNADIVIDDLGHFPLPKDVEEKAIKNGAKIRYDKLDNFISNVDLLVVTRALQVGIIPEDQFPKERQDEVMKNYKPINVEHMKQLRKDAFLYMITPRIFEIDRDVDPDPRCIHSKNDSYAEEGAAILDFVINKVK